MSYKNSEGYSDPTAGVAMGSAKKQEQEIDKLNHKVMQSFRLLLDLAGFEIVGRVILSIRNQGVSLSRKEVLWNDRKRVSEPDQGESCSHKQNDTAERKLKRYAVYYWQS